MRHEDVGTYAIISTIVSIITVPLCIALYIIGITKSNNDPDFMPGGGGEGFSEMVWAAVILMFLALPSTIMAIVYLCKYSEFVVYVVIGFICLIVSLALFAYGGADIYRADMLETGIKEFNWIFVFAIVAGSVASFMASLIMKIYNVSFRIRLPFIILGGISFIVLWKLYETIEDQREKLDEKLDDFYSDIN